MSVLWRIFLSLAVLQGIILSVSSQLTESAPCLNQTQSSTIEFIKITFSPEFQDKLIVKGDDSIQMNYSLYLSLSNISMEEISPTWHNTRSRVLSFESVVGNSTTVEVNYCSHSQENDTFVQPNKTIVRIDGVLRVNGIILGLSDLHLRLNQSRDSPVLFILSVGVILPQRTVDIIFRVFITIFVVTITFTMGATLDSKIIWNYCKRPLAPAIGFLCQYLIMPLTSFALCYIIPIDKVIGFGLLTIGCCPGGGASNIWTVLLRGDLNLSMTMTFLSTVAAFGMMPMWLYLLGGFFIESKVQIPYGQIAVNMLMVVLPALGGMAVKWRSDFIAQKLGRTTQPLAIVFLIFIMTFGTYVHWPIYTVLGDQPIVLLCASLLPLLGFVFGGLFAFVILRSSYPQVIAISLETGIQNIGIAMVVLLYSMPQPYGAMGAIVPIAVSIFSPIPLVALLGIMRCYDRFRKTSDKSVE